MTPMSTAMPRQANANSRKVRAKTGQLVGIGALNKKGAVARITIDTRTRCRSAHGRDAQDRRGRHAVDLVAAKDPGLACRDQRVGDAQQCRASTAKVTIAGTKPGKNVGLSGGMMKPIIR